MSFDFNEVLETKASEIEKPPLLPVGTYLASVTKHEIDRSRDDFEIVNVFAKVVSPMAVDEDELAAFGNVSSAPPLRISFLFDKNDEVKAKQTADRMKRFLLQHLQVEDDTIKAMLVAATNMQFVADVGHRPDKNDPEIVYADVKKTAPAD